MAQLNRNGRNGLSVERALGEIIAGGAASRSDLATRFGASKASISRLVEQLIRRGWVSEGAPMRVAERGRKQLVGGLAAELNPVGLPVPELRLGDELEYKACMGAGLRAIDRRLGEYLSDADARLVRDFGRRSRQ